MGQTSTKGHKGQKARSGGRIRWGFEGGQMPLSRRAPKFGFSNVDFENKFEILNLRDLGRFKGEVTVEGLVTAGLVGKKSKVKILGSGTLEKALRVRVHALSASAKAAIEKAGGTVEVIAE
jgi:large subunit ribosomal protein L15